jgi:hypothetical protein
MIPATGDAEAGGSRSKAVLGKSLRTYLKSKLKQKLLEAGLQG